MSWTASDKRLWRLVKQVILAVEDPEKGILFDDFDRRYREKEWKRENDAAHWFYRDKTSFETKYGEDCGDDPCNEPALVTDGGRGKTALEGVVSYDLDGEEDREDAPARRADEHLGDEVGGGIEARQAQSAARATDAQAHLQEPQQPKGINMLDCDVQTLHPQEWELARQKYFRDLNDLLGLFGYGETVKKSDT